MLTSTHLESCLDHIYTNNADKLFHVSAQRNGGSDFTNTSKSIILHCNVKLRFAKNMLRAQGMYLASRSRIVNFMFVILSFRHTFHILM